MTPKDLITHLAARLRRQGVTFTPADLEAFVAALPGGPAADPNVESLADRFARAQEAAGRKRGRKRLLAWAEGMCIAGMGFVLVGMAATFWLGCMMRRVEEDSIVLAEGMVFLLTAYVGVILVDNGFADAFSGHRRRRRTR